MYSIFSLVLTVSLCSIVITTNVFLVSSFSKDHVKIFNKDGNQVGPRYCGFYPEGYGVKIQGDTARLDFSSNLYIVRNGFNATFEAVLSESPGMKMRHVYIH